MKQRAKGFRTLLALVLALAMVMGNLLTVIAEEGENKTITDAGIDVYCNEPRTASASRNLEEDGKDGWILDGDFESTSQWAVYVSDGGEYNSGEGDTSLTATGDLTAPGGFEPVLQVYTHDDHDTNVTVQGSVIATAPEGDAIDVHSDGESAATVNIGGSVTGNVEVTAGEDAFGGYNAAPTELQTEQAPEGPVSTLDIKGDVNGQVVIGANTEGTANVTIGGEVKVTDLPVSPKDLPPAAVIIDNGFTYKYFNEIKSMALIPVSAGTVNASVGGIETDQEGLISVSGSIEGGEAKTTISVNGDINVTSDGQWADGVDIQVMGDKSETSFTMEGNITVTSEDGESYGAGFYAGEGATLNATITGNVTSDDYGIAIAADEDSSVNIIVDGTVKGDTASAVLVGDTKIGKGVTLTVWKLDGNVIRKEVEDEDVNQDDFYWATDEEPDETPEPNVIGDDEYKEIQYIIRIKDDDDTKKAFKDLKGCTGSIGRSDLGDEYKYITHEDDTVTAIIEAPEGFEIVKAVANAEGMELTKVGEGQYKLTVKRGGGYEIAVTLKELPKPPKPNPDPEPTPDPTPDPEPEPEPAAPETVTITYILGNDTEYDHIRVPAAVGERIALHPAPERDGYTFLYWKGTDVNPGSPYYKEPNPDTDFQFHPGASYTAKKDYNFVAVWKKN